MALTPDERARYARHLSLPEVGEVGQERLRRARVLVVGVGGLGAPASLYLAASGIGCIGLVDDDRVEASNLQRQVLFSTASVGNSKVREAEARLRALNPNVSLLAFEQRFSARSAEALVRGFDVVVDATDNLQTRYVLNDACVLGKKPYVHASIARFEGRVSMFAANGGPCYRCLFPEAPPESLVPSCADEGVLGVVPGIVGSMQALEAMKYIAQMGEVSIGKLRVFDALTMKMTTLSFEREPSCAACGENPSITELASGEIRATELLQAQKEHASCVLLDVREPDEYARGHIEGAISVPLGELEAYAEHIGRHGLVVLYCKTGARSSRGQALLASRGFANARSLQGGFVAWLRDVEATSRVG